MKRGVKKRLRLFVGPWWRRQWRPTPVLLPGKSHGQRSLVGCRPWGREESDMTERLHFHFSLSCIGEGNGNPLQCSCLKNPRDGGAWWAAVYGVAQSRTRLKWLSSSGAMKGGNLSLPDPVIFSAVNDDFAAFWLLFQIFIIEYLQQLPWQGTLFPPEGYGQCVDSQPWLHIRRPFGAF